MTRTVGEFHCKQSLEWSASSYSVTAQEHNILMYVHTYVCIVRVYGECEMLGGASNHHTSVRALCLCVSMCPCVHVSMCPCVHVSVCPCVCVCVCPSVCVLNPQLFPITPPHPAHLRMPSDSLAACTAHHWLQDLWSMQSHFGGQTGTTPAVQLWTRPLAQRELVVAVQG